MIESKAASKRYGPQVVVDQVTLRVPRQGVTAIIGPNGAGKSSLLALLSRLSPPCSGKVSVDGLDLATTPGDVIARRLAILRQDNQLGLRLTVRELVGFGRYPHSHGRLTAEDRPHLERAIADLDLQDLQHRHLDELSGGQRQRAFVAMALCQDTDYLLLDEPLNSLDLRHAVEMMRLLRRLADERGKTIVLVLHDINFASCYADRIVGMRDGRIVCDGPPEEIVHPSVLRTLYGLDVAVHTLDGQRIAVHYR